MFNLNLLLKIILKIFPKDLPESTPTKSNACKQGIEQSKSPYYWLNTIIICADSTLQKRKDCTKIPGRNIKNTATRHALLIFSTRMSLRQCGPAIERRSSKEQVCSREHWLK